MEKKDYYHIRREVQDISDRFQIETETHNTIEEQYLVSNDNYEDSCDYDEYVSDSKYNSSECASNITSISDNLDDFETLNISKELAEWLFESNISEAAGNDLLRRLRKFHPNLPKNVRTLKKTPIEENSLIVPMGEGCYSHIGLRQYVERFLANNKYDRNIIEIDIGIDGVPLAKSSTHQLWPILGNIVQYQEVFLIGIYNGNKKPYCANIFLKSFVDELQDLNESGIIFEHRKIQVQIRSFICDAPARSFILRKFFKQS